MDDIKSPPNIEDICQLERQFREKLYELQTNTVSTIAILINALSINPLYLTQQTYMNLSLKLK